MPYMVTMTGPREPAASRHDTSQAALEKAVELMGQGAEGVCIIAGGEFYSPSDFGSFFAEARVKDAHRA